MEPNLTLLLFYLICGFAATVHGVVGIGFPMIATPLLAMITDVRTAILVIVIPTLILNTINLVQGGAWSKSISRYWPLALYGAIGSFIGTSLLVVIPPETFRPVLAGSILLYLNAERLGVGLSWMRNCPQRAMATFGIGAGLLGGTVNVMLPALVIFALEMKMEKNIMIQVFNFCFLTGKLIQGAVFFHTGLLTAEILKLSIPLVFVSVAATLLAMLYRNKINEQQYKRWLRWLLLALAIFLIIQFVMSCFKVL